MATKTYVDTTNEITQSSQFTDNDIIVVQNNIPENPTEQQKFDAMKKTKLGKLKEYMAKPSVIEGYLYNGVFYRDSVHTHPIVGEHDVIYINLGSQNEDFYRWNGTIYLRTGKDSLTKSQADQYYASKVHTHLFSDISNVSMLTQSEIEDILNSEGD